MSDTDIELVLFVIITLIIDEFLWRFLWLCLKIVKCKLLRAIHFVTGKLRQNKTKLGILLQSYSTAIGFLVGKRFSKTVSDIDEDDKMKNECVRFKTYKGVPDDSPMSTDNGIPAVKVKNGRYSSTGSSATNNEKTEHRTHRNMSAQTVTDKERGASNKSTMDAQTSYGRRTNKENCFAQSNDPKTSKRNVNHTDNKPNMTKVNQKVTCRKAGFESAAEDMLPKAKEKYITIEARLNSFAKWPKRKTIDPGQLASAGLYYTGYRDIVACFACNVQLRDWEQEDDPYIVHARWFPHCPNLLHKKGSVFIERNQIVRPKIAQVKTMNRGVYTSSTLEHRQSLVGHKNNGTGRGAIQQNGTNECSERVLCKLCKIAKRNMLFVPCGHVVVCETCASILPSCLVCNAEISYTIKTYIH
ncbi:death-associated inhibitor of apoptosis 1-like [Ruditapes philippinarum]|uniref:death-associated inhibitor of apoptosis 1-like n=1 Tax=Ruditapes philippinarum TaxID=129788 RepID=UPI00295C1D56|nr:death-associated inhibitor of apoptosis 1-like [Ruditapes philippinarum]